MEMTFVKLNEAIQNSEKAIFVEFWASWCLPCKQYDPMLKEFSKTYEGQCDIYKINIDKNPLASKEFEVRGLPTFIAFKDGVEVSRINAAQPKSVLEKMINEAIEYEDELSEDEQAAVEERLKDLGYL